jgi:hypothetical protein|tara:strand:- start:429 stop:572 length:144 start_codon:yes stop_codon:yes gene_type:complete
VVLIAIFPDKSLGIVPFGIDNIHEETQRKVEEFQSKQQQGKDVHPQE